MCTFTGMHIDTQHKRLYQNNELGIFVLNSKLGLKLVWDAFPTEAISSLMNNIIFSWKHLSNVNDLETTVYKEQLPSIAKVVFVILLPPHSSILILYNSSPQAKSGPLFFGWHRALASVAAHTVQVVILKTGKTEWNEASWNQCDSTTIPL